MALGYQATAIVQLARVVFLVAVWAMLLVCWSWLYDTVESVVLNIF